MLQHQTAVTYGEEEAKLQPFSTSALHVCESKCHAPAVLLSPEESWQYAGPEAGLDSMTEKCLPGIESQRRMVQTDVEEMIQRLPATGRTPKISTCHIKVQEGSLELCPAFVVQDSPKRCVTPPTNSLQGLSFIVLPSMAASMHRKPASC